MPSPYPAARLPRPLRLPRTQTVLAAALLGLLTACGGGGGSAGTPATGTGTTPAGTTTYALQAGFKALTSAGSVDNFNVSGDCTGTAQTVNTAPVPASFEGVTGVAVANSATLSVPTCSNSVSTLSGTTYYSADYAMLGTLSSNGGYSAVAGTPTALPQSVKVGDAQPIFATYAIYSDSTKSNRTGLVVAGYAIEADTAASTTANTAIYHTTSRTYDAQSNLTQTQQAFYRMTPDGTLTLISLDVVFDTLLVQHFVYTRVP